MGHGFVEGNTGVDAAHTAFLANDLACSLRDPSYYALSGSVVRFPDLIPNASSTRPGTIYCAENSCLFTNDVLNVNWACSARRRRRNTRTSAGPAPYISGVYVPSSSAHPYVTLVNGWDMSNLFTRHGVNTLGRLDYFM